MFSHIFTILYLLVYIENLNDSKIFSNFNYTSCYIAITKVIDILIKYTSVLHDYNHVYADKSGRKSLLKLKQISLQCRKVILKLDRTACLCRNNKSRITCRAYNKIYTYQTREKADFMHCSIRRNTKEF